MLILFTNYYPYYKGEEYLEEEIKYLAKEFHEIIIFPTLLNKNMELTRAVPGNVKVYPIFYNNSKLDKIKSAVNSIFRADKETRKIIKNDAGFNLVNKLYDYYFEGRTSEVTKEVIKVLKTLNLDADNVILYSYWFHAAAKIAVDVKNQYFKGKVKRIVARGHRYDIDVKASPIKFLPLRQYLLENIDKLYCVSSNMESELKIKYPNYAYKISTSRLGVKKNSEYPVSSKDPFIIVSCSRARKVKNINYIIESISKLPNNNWFWTHIGDGPELDSLINLANKKLSKHNFSFLGQVSNHQILEWYKKNKPSIFINLSSSEGIPVSIMEAMSFGIPVIATNVGGTNEIVKTENNGFLLELNDIDKASKCIESFMQMNESQYLEYSQNAFNTWDNLYSSDRNYKLFVKELMLGKDNA